MAELATSLSWQSSMLIGTGFCSALAFAISVWLIFKHLLHYNRPTIQKHIVRIIIMIPVRISYDKRVVSQRFFLKSSRSLQMAKMTGSIIELKRRTCECLSLMLSVSFGLFA